MCGICGIYNFNKNMPISREILDSMNKLLTHRGPDGEGIYIDQFIGLGHRRLSIIDLTKGKQPITNEDNTVWLTYNGEIYNYKELKKDLEEKGHRFVTNCDTEVVVHSYEEYGVECVSRFNGMFAFAIWDNKKELVLLARDRMGVKPLYYTICEGNLIFASEIKAILAHPIVKREVEINSVPEYLFCTALLNGNTMFKNIQSLQAGNILIFKDKSKYISQYWDIKVGEENEMCSSFEEYKDKTFSLIKDSVKLRMMSDVPFGSLLSGGLDSSLISALATKHVSGKLSTFSMEYGKNDKLSKLNSDTEYARVMADAFATKHKDFIFEPEDYRENLEKVIWHVEKPVEFTTPSLYLLYKELKKDVTVVLSGEGADELFGGYFFFLKEAENKSITEFPWAPYFKEVSSLLEPEIAKQTNFKEKINTTIFDMMNRSNSKDYLNKVLYLFLKLYLLEMLERQDKTSMAWSVESRVPFLDYRLVEYAASIPSRYKMKGETEKFILKEIGREFLPEGVVNRKKKPFPFPVDPKSVYNQKNIANELVQSGNSKIASYFNKKAVNDFLNKKNEYAKVDSLAIYRTSYSMISLESWHKVFGV